MGLSPRPHLWLSHFHHEYGMVVARCWNIMNVSVGPSLLQGLGQLLVDSQRSLWSFMPYGSRFCWRRGVVSRSLCIAMSWLLPSTMRLIQTIRFGCMLATGQTIRIPSAPDVWAAQKKTARTYRCAGVDTPTMLRKGSVRESRLRYLEQTSIVERSYSGSYFLLLPCQSGRFRDPAEAENGQLALEEPPPESSEWGLADWPS